MSDDRLRTTRRGLLALAGGTAVAGCSALPNPLDSSPPQIGGARLAEITAGRVPTVPQTVPVAVADDHVQGHVDRTQSLLSRAPLPFDERELPNGAMRQELNDTAEEARAILERARSAASPFEAISALRDGRGKGRAVATAWAYADRGLRREDLAGDADALAADVAAFRDRWSYVGDGAVRALLVHGAIEALVRAAAHNVEGRPENPRMTWRPENLVTVSEYAADLERRRAALDDATHLYDRFRAGLTTTRELEDIFDTALGELLDALQTATADFDGSDPVSAFVDADVENSPVRYPLEYLRSDLAHTAPITEHRDRGEVPSALLATHREFTRLRAFEGLRERVEGGESYAIESAEDVAALRRTAVAAIETALRETDRPDLSRKVLQNMAGLVERVDGEIGPYDARERVPVDWIRREAGEYIYAAAVARVTPGVSDAVAELLTA